MSRDSSPEASEIPEWKQFAKAKLAALAGQYGSQRKFAKAWLGSAEKSNQVSEWCNPTNPKFPEAANLVKLRSLGVSIDYLLGGAENQPDEDEWPWAAERKAKLSGELESYCFEVVRNAVRGWGGRGGGRTTFEEDSTATNIVYVRMRGDVLRYLTRHLDRMTRRIIQEVSLPRLYEDAMRWRYEQESQQAEEQAKEEVAVKTRAPGHPAKNET